MKSHRFAPFLQFGHVRDILLSLAPLCAVIYSAQPASAGLVYGDPAGGWTYIFDGGPTNGLGTCRPATCLDGTWSANNGSSEWNGDWRGAGNGVAGGISSDGNILTIEDINLGTGACNNRKIYFTRNLAQDPATTNAGTILDTGITISFRSRLTSADALAEIPLPDGWGVFSDGKAHFNVHQYNGSVHSIVGFSLVRATEPDNSFNFAAAGLTMNRLNGDAPAGGSAVNSSGTAANNQVLPLDPTQFHEFWITIRANDATPGNGTHTVDIYIDGATTPTTFNVTAGTGNESTQNYIAMGLNNSGGQSCYDIDFFAYRQGIFVPAPVTPPAAPANVAVVNGDTQVSLSWSAAATASGYTILRSDSSGGPYAPIAEVSGTSYIDMGLLNGSSYYYVIQATNLAGVSPNSVEVIGRPNPLVSGVTALGGVGQVLVSWDAFPNAASYTVSRSTTSGGPHTVVASGVAGTSHLDMTVAAGRNYYYVVIAQLIGGGDSGQSLEAAALTAPSAPTLTSSLWAATAIRLAWVLNNQVVSGYSIEQSTDGVNFAPLTTVPATPQNYVDANLLASTTYYYRIQATNNSGTSDYSNIASTTTPSFGLNVNFANALNGTPPNNPAPIPPGYAQDIGEPYGPRTNGLTYGWMGTNGVGVDIGIDSRWRMNANSPDLRWDTFNHLQKPQVLPTAVWELDIPVGFYHVYIVSGDPTATDSVFQFDLEGLVTESYVPVTGAWWREFNAELPVEDGRLTVKSGPIAANHKINFIDIYPATPVAPTITAEPQDATTQEFHPVSLSVGSAGSFRRVHQWYHDGVPVPDGTNATLSFPAPQLSDSGQYTVIITNWGGSVTSIVANLTVEPDNEPPFIVSVGSLDGRTIGVCFSELLETNEFAPTTDPFSYFINDSSDIRVTAVTLRPDNKSVSLQLESVSGTGLPMSGQFYVTAVSIRDLKGNGETLSTFGTNTVFGSAGNLGTPPANGTHYTCDNSTIELVGTGLDIWSTADQGYWAYRSISGDFDARVRLDSLSLPATAGPGLTAKGGLIVRQTVDGNSPTLHLLANPLPPGRNLAEAGRRQTVNGTTASWGTNQTALAMPQWLRLVRSGNAFSGYRSSNGVDWIIFATTTQTLPAGLELGLAVTSHTNSATHFTTGQFSNFSLSQPLADLGITMTDSPDPQAVGGNVTYSIGVNNAGPDTANFVTVTDPLPAGVTFVSATASQGTCANAAGVVTCNVGVLASGASATITIVVTTTSAGTLNNTATVTAGAVDSNTANNSASVSTGVATRPTVGMAAYGFGSGFTAGFSTEPGFTYIIEYNDNLSNPAGWTFLSSVAGDGTAKPINDTDTAPSQRFYRIRIE